MNDDMLNPKFVFFPAVAAAGRLPNSALVAHIDAAIRAFGHPCAVTATDLEIDYLEPVVGPQTLRIDIWVEHVDRSSCTYGFLCSSENGNVAYARGERTLYAQFVADNASLRKDLPAYA